METIWWVLTAVLMLLGLFGAIYPIVPDSLLIFAGALLAHFTIKPEHSVGWWTLGVLGVLCIAGHAIDFAAGAMGAKKFGATRWGAIGGVIGGVVGTIFFFPFGLFVGPVVGAFCGELLISRRSLGPAARSSWGTLLGTVAGILGKLAIDVTMVFLFVASALWFHR